MNFQKDILPYIQEKLVVIIGTKDKDRKKKLISNLVTTIALYQTKYKFTKNQNKILQEILKILDKIYNSLQSELDKKPVSVSIDDLRGKFTFDIDDLASKFTFNQPKPSKKSTPKKAGRKFDTSWVDKFYDMVESTTNGHIEGNLTNFINGKEDFFFFSFDNKKGIRIAYQGKTSNSDYIKTTQSKYNNKTKSRVKEFKNKKEFLAALKRLTK